MIESILISAFVGLIYGAWAFLNAYAILPRTWQSALVAIATFGVTALSVKYEIMVLLGILTVALPLTTIILAIFKKG